MSSTVPLGSRLREERERLGLSQTDFGAAAGVGRKTQFNYESDERSPDGEYFAKIAALGIDVRYVITSSRDYEPPPPLTAEEQVLLRYFRESPPVLRRAALGALGHMPSASSSPSANLTFHGRVGSVVQGDVAVSGGVRMTQRGDEKRKSKVKSDTPEQK